jgi:NAD(P)-dependent dehydrogenase (short-subunit alcohol dehydrogenase family)
MNRVQGKTALITGAAQGIGRAIAFELVREGAQVILTDIQDEAGRTAAATCGDGARYRRLDVRREEDWTDVVAWVLQEFGRLDILVNNAGITGFDQDRGPQDPEHTSLASWRAVHETNLDGVFLGCRSGISAMRKGGGSIINISSRSGLVGIPGAAAYASSKAAVRNHTKTVALYCAAQNLNIRCNSVHPAAVLTPMWEPMLGDGPDRQQRMGSIVSDTPLKRFGTPEEVAYVVVYLASDESSYMTGAELNLDGGILAGSSGAPDK